MRLILPAQVRRMRTSQLLALCDEGHLLAYLQPEKGEDRMRVFAGAARVATMILDEIDRRLPVPP